jgi:predicted glycosyltransferase
MEHNGHEIIVTKKENGWVIELVLSSGFETEQQGYYSTEEEAIEAAKVWAEEDWSDYL